MLYCCIVKEKPNRKFVSKAFLILLICCFLPKRLHGQEPLSNIRSKHLLIRSDTIFLDTLSIVPGTFVVEDGLKTALQDSSIIINYVEALLIVKKDKNKYIGAEINIKYRVFPYDFSKKHAYRDTALILPDFKTAKKTRINSNTPKMGFSHKDELKKNGSISRGFMLGNQQDLSTVSNLNLQLSGKINKEVSILAAISDNNLPIQPDGNTQQIQEFDNVFVQLYTKKTGIILGDFELFKPSGYFMNLHKKNRGMKMYSNFRLAKNASYKLYSDFSASLAKGKYNRIKFTGIEGNQGPYRLTGTENEQYVIILSGSEKVYVDGALLVRGQNYDYTIDYNSAEITFTQNRLITKDSRITIEYEYAQQQYPRMVFYQTNKLSKGDNSFWLNFYHDRDNKNDPLSLFYDENAKKKLSEIGDSLAKAVVPNIDSVGYNKDMILYELIDTLVDGQLHNRVYRQSYVPEKAVYRLGFSYVGENKGNYLPKNSTANGKVYQWVAPFNNQPQGSYEPVVLLITPKNKLLASAGGDFRLGKYGKAFVELALSDFNLNSYSNIDKSDDMGYALKFNYLHSLINTDTSLLKLNLLLKYQLADKKFKPIENYHTVEFERDWNLPLNQKTWEEQRGGIGINFYRKHLGVAGFETEFLQTQGNYLGKKAKFYANLKQKGFELVANLSYLKTEDLFNRTTFLRHNVLLAKHFNYFTIGVSENAEKNEWKASRTDSLKLNSFSFNEYKVFLNQPDSSKQKYFLFYKLRENRLPFNNNIEISDKSKDLGSGLSVFHKKGIRINGRLNYREISFRDTLSSKYKEENALTGRAELFLQLFKGAISWSTFYETGFGFETKKDYQYIEVPAGQGQFTWIDYNKNNIKELDEFEYAKFSDQATYIRIVLPGRETEKIFLTKVNQSINLQPARLWSKSNGFKKVLSHFSNNIAFRVLQKANHDDYIPDFTDNPDILKLNWNLRDVFSFRSANRNWQTDYIYDESKMKIPLVSGTEYRENLRHTLKLKWRINKSFTLINDMMSGSQLNFSEFFVWKSYHIKSLTDEAAFQYQPKISWSAKIAYRHQDKVNTIGMEKSNLQEIKLSYNQNIFKKGNIQADFSTININYNGDALNPVAYEMLEGLMPGHNIVWNLSYNQRLSEIFQLSLNYNGRINGNSPMIHNGGVQLGANF